MTDADEESRQLRTVWERVLRTSPSADTDFFSEGGDSVLATMMVSDLGATLGLPLTTGFLYEHPRFGDAVAALRGLCVKAGKPSLPPVRVDGPREGSHPLSYQQIGQLQLGERVLDHHRYQLMYAVRLPPLDEGRLRAAVAALVTRHPALRTGFHRRGDNWEQEVLATIPQLEAGTTTGDAVAAARRWAAPPFQLDGRPLCRMGAFTDPAGTVLAVSAEQLVMDPWSWGVMLRELSTLYDAPDTPLPQATAYSDYARWQQRHIDPQYARHRRFWRQVVEGYPARGVALPGAPEQPAPAGPAAAVPLLVPASQAGALQARAAARGATLFQLLLAEFATTLSAWSGHNDVVIGSATANRAVPGTEGTVGFFVNGRFTRLRDCSAPETTLGQVREAWVAGDNHEQAHLEKLVHDLGVPDMVNVKFSYNAIPALADLPPIAGARPEPVRVAETVSSRRHLAATLTPGAGGSLSGALTYRTDVLPPTAAAAFALAFQHQLARTADLS